MKATWNPHVSLRFVCVRRRLGLKDTEFGSGAILGSVAVAPRSLPPVLAFSGCQPLLGATVLWNGWLTKATAWCFDPGVVLRVFPLVPATSLSSALASSRTK